MNGQFQTSISGPRRRTVALLTAATCRPPLWFYSACELERWGRVSFVYRGVPPCAHLLGWRIGKTNPRLPSPSPVPVRALPFLMPIIDHFLVTGAPCCQLRYARRLPSSACHQPFCERYPCRLPDSEFEERFAATAHRQHQVSSEFSFFCFWF